MGWMHNCSAWHNLMLANFSAKESSWMNKSPTQRRHVKSMVIAIDVWPEMLHSLQACQPVKLKILKLGSVANKSKPRYREAHPLSM